MTRITAIDRKTAFVAAVAALAVIFALALVAAPSAHALAKGQTFKVAGNTYKVTDYEPYDDDPPEARLVKYGSSNKTPVINTVTYKGILFEVEEIGKNAFNNAKGHKITSVTIGRHVDEIGSKAFYGCKKLKTINMRASEVIDLDREGGTYVIDDLDIGYKAFKNAGTKSIKVKCGSKNSTYKKVFKSALKMCGMRSTVKVVY